MVKPKINYEDMPSATIRLYIQKHDEARPDHLKALHPLAPQEARDEFRRWMRLNDELHQALEIATNRERAGWRDGTGKPVEGITWGKGVTAETAELRRVAAERQKYRLTNERKVAEAKAPYDPSAHLKPHTHEDAVRFGNMGGRKRQDNPTPEAIKKREKRERLRHEREERERRNRAAVDLEGLESGGLPGEARGAVPPPQQGERTCVHP